MHGTKHNTPERAEELRQRRLKQRMAVPSKEYKARGKYTPAGEHKNLQPHNR